MSFFDDGEETATASRPQARAPRAPRRPQPRRAQHGADPHALDQHTLMVRRRVAAGVGVVLLIVIVLVVNGCLKSQQKQSLETYNRDVSRIAQESEQQVSKPFFAELADANSQVGARRREPARPAAHPGPEPGGRRQGPERAGRDDAAPSATCCWRSTSAPKASPRSRASCAPRSAGKAKQASTLIAGDMEIFLASDVIYSQRVAPLIQQTLAGNGIQGQSTAASRFLPNIGWLEPTTVYARLTGQPAGSSSSGGVTPGHHGSVLKGVSVGTKALEAEPALNHISGGSSPTFTVMVENDGEFPETDVKVDLNVTAGGKQLKASHVIDTTEPKKTVNAEIPVSGIPPNVASKIEVQIEPVPGETNHEGTKGTFLGIFE